MEAAACKEVVKPHNLIFLCVAQSGAAALMCIRCFVKNSPCDIIEVENKDHDNTFLSSSLQ